MCISPFFSSLPFLLSLFNINTMEEVAEILSGQYGIRQVGKSAPMLASKPSTITSLSSSNTHHSQQTLSTSFEDLVAKGGNNISDDPFLIFDKGFSTSDQISFKPNAIQPSLFVDESDFFNFDGNPRDVDQKKPLMTDSTIPKPPSLENFDFLKMYESGLDQKDVLVNGMGEGGNESYNGIDAFFSGLGLGGSWEPRQMDVNSDNIFGSSFESQELLGRCQGVSTPSKFNLNESSFGIEAIQSCTKLEDVGGDNDYRRRARYAREVTKFARAERALAEKNERDFNMQREQNEKERFSEELDREIKQWAAGREGNLRALLSTLHCILWPECGWQPMSLGNLMTSSAVKKAYGKAALCIHPDKVQQKGSNLRQKYVAEKVFYLLTEALNKFSSEELK